MLGKVIEYSNPKSFTLQLLPIAQDKFVEGKLRSTKKKGGVSFTHTPWTLVQDEWKVREIYLLAENQNILIVRVIVQKLQKWKRYKEKKVQKNNSNFHFW